MPSHTPEVRRWNNLLPHADHVHTHTLTHNCALHQPNTIHAAPHLRFKLYYGAEQPAPPADQQLLGHPSGHPCRLLHGSRRLQIDHPFPFQPTKRWVPSPCQKVPCSVRWPGGLLGATHANAGCSRPNSSGTNPPRPRGQAAATHCPSSLSLPCHVELACLRNRPLPSKANLYQMKHSPPL